MNQPEPTPVFIAALAKAVQQEACQNQITHIACTNSCTLLGKKWAKQLRSKGYKCGDVLTPTRGTPTPGTLHILLCRCHADSSCIRWFLDLTPAAR